MSRRTHTGVTNGKLDKKTPEPGSLCSWLHPQDLNISIVKMILSLFFFCVCGIVTSSPVAEVEPSTFSEFAKIFSSFFKMTIDQVEEDRGLVGDIAMGILVGKIQEMLGITTTPKPRPIIGIMIGAISSKNQNRKIRRTTRSTCFPQMASPAFSGEKPRRQPPHPPTRRSKRFYFIPIIFCIFCIFADLISSKPLLYFVVFACFAYCARPTDEEK